MIASKNNFLDHVKLLRQAVLAHGADLIIAGNSLQALIRKGSRHFTLEPQFLTSVDGDRQYSTTLTDATSQFVGWLPYRHKRWPISSDKLTFKRYAQSIGLKVPEYSAAPASEMTDVVVKRAISSFGEQVKGPFRSASEFQLDVAQGDYYERFVEGRLLKLWYWNDQPICAELDNLPAVLGDGVLTLGELIVRRASIAMFHNEQQKRDLLAKSDALLRYLGTSQSAVLPYGVRQVVEYRYGSTVMLRSDRRVIDLLSTPPTGWMASLAEVGRSLYAGIPPVVRPGTLFTVDGILDSQQKIWLLEMNSNPTVHPLAYEPIVAELLRGEEASGPDAKPAAPRSSSPASSVPHLAATP